MKVITRSKFTGKENHAITSLEGIDFLKNGRTQNPGAASGCYADAKAVQALIDQPGAVGLRYYYTLNEAGRKGLVLVGADADRQDIIRGGAVKLAMYAAPFTQQGDYDTTRVNHDVALEDAALLTANYRRENPGIKGGFFGKEALQALLAQQDCVGIYFLYGSKPDATPVLVLVGVDKFGADMFYGSFVEYSALCPPVCGSDNLLNASISNVSNSKSDAYSETQYLKAA